MGSNTERELKKKMEEAGWFVARAAGSLGLADLVAIKPIGTVNTKDGVRRAARAILIEEKETVDEKTFYFSDSGGKARNQWNGLRELVRQGHTVFWGVKFKRGERANRWRFWPVLDEDSAPLKRDTGLTFEEVFG